MNIRLKLVRTPLNVFFAAFKIILFSLSVTRPPVTRPSDWWPSGENGGLVIWMRCWWFESYRAQDFS